MGSVANSAPLRIGGAVGSSGGYPGYTGDIDEAAVYTRALTDAQVVDRLETALPDGDLSVDPTGASQPADGDPTPSEALPDSTDSWDAPPADHEPTGSTVIDRGAIVDYANRYVGRLNTNSSEGYNPAYAHYGNDCTNFVSQALKAGGWPMRDRGIAWDVWNPAYWYYAPGDWSYTWTVAGYLLRYSKSYSVPLRGTFTKYMKALRLGDIVFADWHGRRGIPTHSMIVTRIGTNAAGDYDVWLTYHTTNRLNKSFRVLRKKNRNAIFWKFHLYNSF